MADKVIIDKDKDVVSVQDKYLYYLLNGGDFATLPEPRSRQDKYLYLLCLKRDTIEEINVSEWLYGNGNPSTAPTPIGADKDYYIDRTTGDIYRKEGEEWKNIQLNIKGDQGIQGVKGDKGDPFAVAKTYASVKDMETGFANDGVKEGQFVIITNDVNNVDNAKLYVRGKDKYTFVTDMSGATGIKGDKGERGEQGIQGIQGLQGIQGKQGETGKQGIQGERGLQGEKGAKGDTGVGIESINVTPSNVDGGENKVTIKTTDGKETSFTVKNGSKGDKGETGATGQAGASGVATQGTNGADGKTWKPSVDAQGMLSWKIDNTDTVPQTVNIKGATGNAGKNGLDGSKWYSGDDPNTITDAKNGDFYLKNDGTVWTHNGTQWQDTKISLKGQKGDTGAKGEPGATTTTSGQTVAGAKGDKGDTWRPNYDTTSGQLSWTLESNPTSDKAPATVTIKGVDGKPGKNGTTWYSGANAPANANLTDAVEGDFYLQSNGKVWQLKGTQWVEAGVNLKGEKGENGKDGQVVTQQGQAVAGTPGKDGANGKTFRPTIANNQITWTASDDTSNVNFAIPEEITISDKQPTTKVWIDISGNTTT